MGARRIIKGQLRNAAGELIYEIVDGKVTVNKEQPAPRRKRHGSPPKPARAWSDLDLGPCKYRAECATCKEGGKLFCDYGGARRAAYPREGDKGPLCWECKVDESKRV